MKLKISMCTYQDEHFELFLEGEEYGERLTISGDRKFTEEEFQFFQKYMPACVMTKYECSDV